MRIASIASNRAYSRRGAADAVNRDHGGWAKVELDSRYQAAVGAWEDDCPPIKTISFDYR
jgi:hypothetical protein